MLCVVTLRRELGLLGAVGVGLGSILGTGVFVALAIAAGEAGAWLPLAVLLGGVVATFNGLSSAQLAAVHPVAGGTYAYGRKFLHPYAGFVAGVTFLAAKSASAATAALGVAGYLSLALGLPGWIRVPLALSVVLILTLLVQRGLRRSSVVNLVLVSVTLSGLVLFVAASFAAGSDLWGWTALQDGTAAPLSPTWQSVLYAVALSFVAYTGYGRVATMGEEVRDPARTIPRAVVVTLVVSALVYTLVAFAAVWAVGPAGMAAASVGAAAPLVAITQSFSGPVGLPGGLAGWLTVAAISAMAGVLLNLILGLSRVAFAMARDGEAPASLARLDAAGDNPSVAVWAVAVVVMGLAATGDVRLTWSFSALTVLLYYGLANLAALRVMEGRFLPRWVSVAGLISCLGLTFFVPLAAWIPAVLVVGFMTVVRAMSQRKN